MFPALDVECTRAPRDAARIAREAVRAGVERLIVAGGDGTTSEVVTGLLDADLGGYAELAILPLGTGGDFRRTLGSPRALAEAIAGLRDGQSRQVDAGRVRYCDRDGAQRTAYFLNVASFGITGLVDELVNQAPKNFGGGVSFMLGTLRAITRYQPVSVKIKVDGKVIHDGRLVLAAAANGRCFGGGMQIAPDAHPADGQLDVVVIDDMSKPALMKKLPSLYRGTHLSYPSVSVVRGRVIEAEAEPGTTCEPVKAWMDIDGEPLGTLPCRIEVLPDAISFFGLTSPS